MSTEICPSCGKPTIDCTYPYGGHEEGILFEGVYYPYENQGGSSSNESSDATSDSTSEELPSAN
ncbi:hypothetical protein PspLS_01136 [Pyricularia sp. CBS 133598]|nr:hypothetical protein PspLS_01136 [Pyricularia sp. CBS 133598]